MKPEQKNFYSRLKTINRLTTDNAADIVYKGTLGTVLKDAMVAACHSRESAKRGERGPVDLMDVVKNFEEHLLQPSSKVRVIPRAIFSFFTLKILLKNKKILDTSQTKIRL